jgi:hypothetical protein
MPSGRCEQVGVDAGNGWQAPEGQFALTVRAYVPTPPDLAGSYKLPNVRPNVERV